MSPVNKFIEKNEIGLEGTNRCLICTWFIFKAVTTVAVSWCLQGPSFGLVFTSLIGGEVGKKMKGLCLLPIPEVPGASFPRSWLLGVFNVTLVFAWMLLVLMNFIHPSPSFL